MSDLSICIVLRVFVVVLSILCLLYVSLGLRGFQVFLVDVHGKCGVYL